MISIRTTLLILAGSSLAFADPVVAQPRPVPPPPALQDGQRDFDFELGTWTMKLSRLDKPLTGSSNWVTYEGKSQLKTVWDGRANLGEIDLQGRSGSIRGLSLRLYNPETRQWSIHWANARDGQIGPAMVGGFRDGRGEFYNQETFDGRAVIVRFIFSDITADSFRFEQAFSADGGRTWEPNWIATFERASEM
jgi:hypothetical protein